MVIAVGEVLALHNGSFRSGGAFVKVSVACQELAATFNRLG